MCCMFDFTAVGLGVIVGKHGSIPGRKLSGKNAQLSNVSCLFTKKTKPKPINQLINQKRRHDKTQKNMQGKSVFNLKVD